MRFRWGRVTAAGMAVVAVAAAGWQAGAASAAPAAQHAAHGTVAVSQVQKLIDTVRGEAHTYAGLWLDRAVNTVFVGTPLGSVTPASVAGMVKAPAAGVKTMRIRVVRDRFDWAQLTAIDARVRHDAGLRSAARKSGAVLSEWYPDPVTDKVVIGFTKVTPAEVAAVRAGYGSTARVVTQVIAQASTGRISPSQERSLASRHRIVPDSRTVDSPPWYGGDWITGGNGVGCTSGYEFGSGAMSTAGHCGATNWDNNGNFYGGTFTIQWGNGRIDMQLMNGSSYDPYIWAGPGGNSPEPVSGSGGVAQGGGYCTGGAITDQNCSAVVDAIDVCQVVNDNGTNVNVCDLDRAHSSNGTALMRSGDSGGPVYTNYSTNDPFAVGTLSSYLGTDCWWSDMYMEKVIFHSAPAIG